MKLKLTDAEWGDVLATLPENPETADGWELSLVRRTVERVLRDGLADAWEEGAAHGSRGLLPKAKRDERNPYHEDGE